MMACVMIAKARAAIPTDLEARKLRVDQNPVRQVVKVL
jgi:hypothetical protein